MLQGHSHTDIDTTCGCRRFLKIHTARVEHISHMTRLHDKSVHVITHIFYILLYEVSCQIHKLII